MTEAVLQVSPLSGMSDEVLGHVAWFLHGEGIMHLLLTGDKALRHKMARNHQLSVVWKHPSYCVWNECLPLINSFPHILELSLRTLSLYHLSSKPLDLQTLPSHLTLLDLQFRGALDLLITEPRPKLAVHFPSLRTLSLSQGVNARGQEQGLIRLDLLPACLEHLVLSNNNPHSLYKFQVEDLMMLPGDLRTFSVPFAGVHDSGRARIMEDLFVRFQGLSLLSSLTVYAPEGSFIDITHVAATLKHLSVRGVVTYEGKPILVDIDDPISTDTPWDWAKHTRTNIGILAEEFKRAAAIPIRSILPKLESLQMHDDVLLSWDCFESLPLSMTRLRGNFAMNRHAAEMCERLNQLYLQGQGEDRPAAPIMFREFRVSSPYFYYPDYFKNVDYVDLIESRRTMSADSLPRTIRTLAITRLEGDLTLCPPSLTSLTCETLDLQSCADDKDDKSGEIETANQRLQSPLPPLSTLTLIATPLSRKLVSLLPASLEHLSVLFECKEALVDLKVRCDDLRSLPRLTSLSVRVSTHPSDKIPLISLDSIPASLTTLRIKGVCTFAERSSPASLRMHPNLTHLDATAQRSEDVFANLPRRLQHLALTLLTPVNLNNPLIVSDLLSLPQNLRFLSLSMIPNVPNDWFIPLATKSLTRAIMLQFSAKHRHLFGAMLLLPSWAWDDPLALGLSECFFYSVCLPSTLVELHTEYASRPAHNYNLPGTINSILETRLTNPWNDLKRFLIGRIPALSVFISCDREVDQQTMCRTLTTDYYTFRREEIMPRNLSYFGTRPEYVRDRHLKHALKSLRSRKRYFAPNVDYYSALIGMQVANIAAWSLMTWTFALQPQDHLLSWLYQWCNLLGSAAALPVLWVRLRKARRTRFVQARRPLKTTDIGLYTLWNLLLSLAMHHAAASALGWTSPTGLWGGFLGRAVLFGVALATSAIADFSSFIFFRSTK